MAKETFEQMIARVTAKRASSGPSGRSGGPPPPPKLSPSPVKVPAPSPAKPKGPGGA